MTDATTGLTPSMEDYLEAIHELSGEKRVVRIKDIARRMGVRMPSVTGALKTLGGRGLVAHERYEDVELTPTGERIAKGVLERHRQIRGFLMHVLGMPEATAEEEACKLEHSVAPETLERLVEFVGRVLGCGGGHPECLRPARGRGERVDA